MPIRRPSASGAFIAPTSASRAHKSNGSHHALAPRAAPALAVGMAGATATPQQKIVQVLVNRLKNKLPSNSGQPLDVLESDKAIGQSIEALVDLSRDSLDIIAWALTELLERLAKPDANGILSVEVLQSQLLLLKVLSVAMASGWRKHQDESPNPLQACDPPPLNENCARYILSVMILYLRQTSFPDHNLVHITSYVVDSSFRDYEWPDVSPNAALDISVDGNLANLASVPPVDSSVTLPNPNSTRSSCVPIPPGSWNYEKAHTTQIRSPNSMNILIRKYTGRIIFHLSASNWTAVLYRLRTRVRSLAQTSDEKSDIVDMGLMTHCALDKVRLIQVLNELSSLLVNMKREVQVALAIPLRAAIWNWIEIFPAEFNEALRSRGRLESAPERVFDLLYSPQPGCEKSVWPTLTILSCISSERLSVDLQMSNFGAGVGGGQRSLRKENRFIEELIRHANTSSKLAELSLVCALDICKAAAYLQGEDDLPLRSVAFDIAHEVKSALWKNSLQKPFWDSGDEIDLDLYSQALVTVYWFLPEEESLRLFTACLEPDRSDAVKVCVVKACLILALESPRLAKKQSMKNLELTVSGRFRSIFKAAALRRNEVDLYGHVKRAATRPKIKRTGTDTLVDREVLLLGLLSLWRTTYGFFLTGSDTKDTDEWFAACLKVWESPLDDTVKISMAGSFQLMIELVFRMSPSHPMYEGSAAWLKPVLAEILITICGHLIQARHDYKDESLWMKMAQKMMELYCRKNFVLKEVQMAPERIPAFALAIVAFCISLTSADSMVSQTAAQCLRLIALAESQPDAPPNPHFCDEELSKRNPIFLQLGDPNVAIFGRVGYQKRIRKLVRFLAYPSAIHVAVWQECYCRWRALSEFVLEAQPYVVEEADKNYYTLSWEEKHVRWRNLTLFLAAFGGACVNDGPELPPLSNVVPVQYLPDQMRDLQDYRVLVETFVLELTAMLSVESMQVREIAREALGSELSPRLYSRLVKHLDEMIRHITQSPEPVLAEASASLLDQYMAVLKLLIENTQVPAEEIYNMDLSSTLLALAGSVARFDSPSTSRIKIKYCALCDSVCSRTDTLSFRKDAADRRNILDIIMEWIQDPASLSDMEAARAQVDLNIVSLRTAVKLLDRLQLRPLDGSVGDDSSHVVARLFNRYSSILLKGLDLCHTEVPTSDSASNVPSLHKRSRVSQREAELHELVVTGLSNLVSANTESGFKQCLPLAYDQDTRKRSIFAHVFSRVLGQGTKFDQHQTAPTASRRSRLCELVTGSDMVLAMAICETCPPSEVDIIISVLLNLFDTRTSLVNLLKLMIDREISHTESEASLFRGNTTYTRFLSAFAKVHGYNYLRGLIVPLVKLMADLPPGQGYELDPAKAGAQDVERNRVTVEFVARSFLEIISASVSALPSIFREVCAHIAKSVNEVWPDSKFAALGAFIFLRFISPAIVAPEIVDVELPKDEEGAIIRRGLRVIAKIIQNLANNIFFGKEAFMVGLNSFLQDNIVNVTRYLSEVNKYSSAVVGDDADEWLGNTPDHTDTIVLHRYFEKHADKIGKELLSLSKVNEVDQTAINGKRAWDGLCAALVDLGQALEVPRISPYTNGEHREYLDLMSRCANRNVDAVRDIFVETPAPKDQPAVFIFRISQIDVEALDIELLMFHIFKTLNLPAYEQRPFEIIVDCTEFTSAAEIPVSWIKKYCTELIPKDVRERLLTTYILNANALMQRYLRRLYNISAGNHFSGVLRTCTSVGELQRHKLPAGCIASLVYASHYEEEPCEEFDDIVMRQLHQMPVPVILHVARTHLRITSVKALPISPSLSCRATEIIPLKDISDVYNVSTGHDHQEFIVRRSRQGITLYFSSSLRDTIVKKIRGAKGRSGQTSVSDGFSRFSNVPATLLHVSIFSINSQDEELRSAAYDLLGAVCCYVGYDKNPVVASKAGFIPGDPNAFAAQLSERLADFIPAMTLDFISEVIAGMPKSLSQAINCLQYISPWIKNLAQFPNPTSPHYEHSGARLRDCIRALTDLTLNQTELSNVIQRCVWSEIGKLDSTAVNVVLEELIRSAVDGGAGSQRCEVIARIVAGISSINVRGRIYSKLRKNLGKTTGRASRTLADNIHWNEVATLIRLALAAGNLSKQTSHHQLYVPEIAHIVTITSGTGQTLVRKSVYGIVMNLLQALYLTRAEDPSCSDLLVLINECTQAETLQLFGLARTTLTSEYINYDPLSDKISLDNQEKLARLFVKIMETTAGSQGLLNVWRARWMSLVTSTAFQLSPALQTRAFVVLGVLASSDVDDDLFYQILVASKTAVAQLTDTDTTSVVSVLRCVRKVIPALADNSRYIFQVFWLGVALVQCCHVALHAEACNILRVTLEVMDARGLLQGPVHALLLDHRAPLDDIASQMDHLIDLSFDTSFSFSLSAIVLKGVRHSGLRDSTEALLRTLLRITLRSAALLEPAPRASLPPDVLGYFLALVPFSTTPESYRRLLDECGAEPRWFPNGRGEATEEEGDVPRLSVDFLAVHDSNMALLVATFVSVMLTSAQGNDSESEMLYIVLSDIGGVFPEIVSMIYESLQDRIKDTFANSSNAAIIKAVSTIFRVALKDPRRIGLSKTSVTTLHTLDESSHGPGQHHLRALDELAMQGLATNFQFASINREVASPGIGTRVLQLIPELINRIME